MTRLTRGPWSFDDEPPAHGERLTIARLEWCLDAFAKLGCPARDSSRFPASLRFLKRINREPSLIDDEAARVQVAEIHRSTWELMLILRAAARVARNSSPFTAAKLREIQRGGIASDASHARNTQFELYIAAVFDEAGFTVSRGDPDARLHYYNEDVGMEAKRVNSLNTDTLRGTLSRAARQITGTSTSSIIEVVRSRGFIAINLDVFFEDLVPSGDNTELISAFEKKLAILDKETRVLRDRIGIFGLMAAGHVAHWRRSGNPEHWLLGTLYPFRWMSLHGEDPADLAIARNFVDHMGRIESKVLGLRTKLPRPLSDDIPPAANVPHPTRRPI